jgi:hypothetical protein
MSPCETGGGRGELPWVMRWTAADSASSVLVAFSFLSTCCDPHCGAIANIDGIPLHCSKQTPTLVYNRHDGDDKLNDSHEQPMIDLLASMHAYHCMCALGSCIVTAVCIVLVWCAGPNRDQPG